MSRRRSKSAAGSSEEKNTHKQEAPDKAQSGPKPKLQIEALEPRILLSGTWVDADTADPISGPTDDADIFYGTNSDESASASKGNDVLYGYGGKDSLDGGEGDDILWGGGGNDTLQGNEGNDQLYGEAGNDKLEGKQGDDLLVGGAGNDELYGNEGNDVIDGGGGNDYMHGDIGNDTFQFNGAKHGNAFTVAGGQGNDTIDLSQYAANQVSNNGSRITVDLGDAKSFTIDHSEIENVVTAPTPPPNTAPTAGDGSLTLNEDAAGTVVLGGSDPDAGDAVTQYRLESLPSNGELHLNGSAVHTGDVVTQAQIDGGELTFQPDADWNGSTSFTYKAHDGDAWSDSTGTFNIQVNAANDAPTAGDSSLTMDEDSVGTVVLSASDPDAGDEVTQYQVETLPEHGVLRLNGEAVSAGDLVTQAQIDAGELTFQPDAEWNGSTSFAYKAHDGEAWSATASDFAINVTADNSDLTAGDDVFHGTGAAETVDGLGGDDVLNGAGGDDQLSGGSGDDILRGSGGNDALSGGDGNDLVRGGGGGDDLHGDAGNDMLRGEGGNDTVHGGEGADTLIGGSGADTLLGGDGADVLRGGGGNDLLDGGAGDDVLRGGSGADQFHTSGGNDQLNGESGNDTFHFAGAQNGDVYTVDGGRQGTDTIDLSAYSTENVHQSPGRIDVTLADGGSFSILHHGVEKINIGGHESALEGSEGQAGDSDDATDDLEDGNIAPVADAGGDVVVDGGSQVVLNASNSLDHDATGENVYTWLQVDGPAVSLSGAHSPTPEFTAPVVDAPTTLTFQVQVSDGQLSSTDTVTVTVNPVESFPLNEVPSAWDVDLNVNEDNGPVAVILQGSDPDAGDAVTQYRLESLPSSGELHLNGSVVNAGDVVTQAQIDAGELTFQPDADWNGSTSFTYKAHDGDAWSANTGTFNIQVNAANDTPTATDGTLTLNEDSSGVVSLSGSDSDAGDAVMQYRLESLPSNGALRLNGSTVNAGDVVTQAQIDAGELTFQPDADWNGSTSFTYKAHDGDAWSANTGTFDITVTPVEDSVVDAGNESSEGSQPPSDLGSNEQAPVHGGSDDSEAPSGSGQGESQPSDSGPVAETPPTEPPPSGLSSAPPAGGSDAVTNDDEEQVLSGGGTTGDPYSGTAEPPAPVSSDAFNPTSGFGADSNDGQESANVSTDVGDSLSGSLGVQPLPLAGGQTGVPQTGSGGASTTGGAPTTGSSGPTGEAPAVPGPVAGPRTSSIAGTHDAPGAGSQSDSSDGIADERPGGPAWNDSDLNRMQVLNAMEGHEHDVELRRYATDLTAGYGDGRGSVAAKWGLSSDYEVVYELVQPPVQSLAAASLEALMQGPKPGLTAFDLYESIPREEKPHGEVVAAIHDESARRTARHEPVEAEVDHGTGSGGSIAHKVLAAGALAGPAAAGSSGFFAQLWSLLRGFGGRSRSTEPTSDAEKSGRASAGR